MVGRSPTKKGVQGERLPQRLLSLRSGVTKASLRYFRESNKGVSAYPDKSEKQFFAPYGAHVWKERDNIKRTISGRLGKGSIGHDNRKFIANNVDASRTDQNIVLVQDDIEQVYHELFDEALVEYNARQTRKDRRIKNYYEHIKRSKQEKPFYEVIFQIGNNEDTRCGTAEAVITTKALTDFVKSFQKRNPQLRVFNAVIHLDEETPHVHLDFVPFVKGQKRGLSTRNSLTGALEQQGFKGEGKMNTCSKLWVDSEKQALAEIMSGYGIEWEQLGTHEQHLDVLDYKKNMRTRDVAVLENKVECTQHLLENTQQFLMMPIRRSNGWTPNLPKRARLWKRLTRSLPIKMRSCRKSRTSLRSIGRCSKNQQKKCLP
ncbi:MAG: plasmid recombination protein [Ruminococcus sp.]|nr:plasmid recombination protein [Ruminococcus sp.]